MHRVVAGLAAATTAALVLGTMPAVGGYSNVSPGDDFTTVGIVTQVEGGAFAVAAGKSTGETIELGRGVLAGDRMWVESHALVRMTDTSGSRLTISGPAAVEFTKKGRNHNVVRVTRGSVKFHAIDGHPMYFENAFVAGLVAGEAAVWASAELMQIAGLAGDVKAWHPHLTSAQVLIAPGFFTESSIGFKHLQPKRPVRAEGGLFETFLARFEEPVSSESRAIASEGKPEQLEESAPPMGRGSRTRSDVVEAGSRDVMARLKAHIRGRDPGEREEAPLAAKAPVGKVQYNAFGQPVKPKFEVVKKTEEPNEEEKALIQDLSGTMHGN